MIHVRREGRPLRAESHYDNYDPCKGKGHKGLKVIMIHVRGRGRPLRAESYYDPYEERGLTTKS